MNHDHDELKKSIIRIIYDALDNDPFAKIAHNQYRPSLFEEMAEKIIQVIAERR